MFKKQTIEALAQKDAAGQPAPLNKSVSITEPTKENKGGSTNGGGNSNNNAPATPGKLTKEKSGNKSPGTPVFTKEAMKALGGGIADAIVDLKVSNTEPQEVALSRNGYVQLLQEQLILPGQKNNANVSSSTFGNKTSIWIWRRSFGTCSGRLKPIIDVILYPSMVSTDLVLAGYTCDPVAIAGQYLWCKRAQSEEEEKDAIIDLYVTTGKSRDTSDSIWQTPGVGWIRIEGNFTKSFFGGIDSFVWYRPARSRSMDTQMTNPIKGSVALTDEVRQTKIIAAVRLALRHYVPVNDVKRLANLVMEGNEIAASAPSSSMIRSERMMDFATVYHHYANNGKLQGSKWSKLLHDGGINMKPSDVTQCFNFFDTNHNGFITIEEYAMVLALTDYELDLALERIRLKLLLPCVPKELQKQHSQKSNSSNSVANLTEKANVGVIGAQSIQQHPYIGKNKIRENLTLSHIFQMINVKSDQILSLDEIMDLASKVEVFLTEEEARKIITMMDLDGDDRIEEADFIAFMRRESVSVAKKAFRIRESSALLRRWLVRGTSEKLDSSSNTAATASKLQWKQFKIRYEKSTGQKFPGFLSSHVLQLTLANLGVRLSSLEARELALVMAPEKNGRVHLTELHAFMARNCRSFGELIALLQRDLFTDVLDSYRAYRQSVKSTGKEDVDLLNVYRKKIDEMKKVIENVYNKSNKNNANANNKASDGSAHNKDIIDRDDYLKRDEEEDDDDDDEMMTRAQPIQQIVVPDPTQRFRKANHEVISVTQLRQGIQDLFEKKKIPDSIFPNLEEWACLAVLVDADVAEGDIYGVRLKAFLEGICSYIYTTSIDNNTMQTLSEKVMLDIMTRELKLQIYREARVYAYNKRQKAPDYQAVFGMFDRDGNGVISLAEFKAQLQKLQLVNLTDSQFTMLLAMFDKSKRGSITFQDFQNFAEDASDHLDDEDLYLQMAQNPNGNDLDHFDQDFKAIRDRQQRKSSNNAGDDSDGSDFSDDEDSSLLLSKNNGIPPIPVTRDGDCDWLLWYLYRQAYRLAPMDAESVITDLEAVCSETEMTQEKPNISVKELWNILYELQLQQGLSKEQYLKGIAYLCDFSNSVTRKERGVIMDEDRVDYIAMCKYCVKMGRAFLANVQDKRRDVEKNFPVLLPGLKKYFQELCEEAKRDRHDAPRYEKIFRRIDRDGDGMLTTKEFYRGLKQLQFKDVKVWRGRMIRRLFDECDKNKDGLISIKEFTLYVLDKQVDTTNYNQQSRRLLPPGSARKRGGGDEFAETTGKSLDKLNLSDNEEEVDGEDDAFFRKTRAISDHELIRKMNEVLLEIVPRDGAAYPMDDKQHYEQVRQSVRRFFQRADPDYSGVASEERFRAFLRRSGLQDKLTPSELRRITEKLKRKVKGKEGPSVMIDYEKLCQQLLVVSESIPKSKAETVYMKFQDCAIQSAGVGRSFLNLCSLVDLHLTGRISKEDIQYIAKMMDFSEMTMYDVESMLELVPQCVVDSPSHSVGRNSNSYKIIDYRALAHALETFTPRGNHRDLDTRVSSNTMLRNSSTGALPAYASPFQLTHLGASTNFNGGAIQTPLGYSINSPMKNMDLTNTLFGQMSQNSTYEKIVRILFDRIRLAMEEKSKSWNTTFSLRKKFEHVDFSNSGLISTRTLQQVLEELGVVVSSSELQSIYHLYGKPDDDRIFYDSFCRAIDSNGSMGNSSNSMAVLGSTTTLGGGEPAYVNPRVMQRIKELRQEGRNPRDMFEAYDLERAGMVLVSKFKEVVTRLNLLTTDHQLIKAMEDFATIGNRSFVNYEDFCDTLERAYQQHFSNPNAGLGNTLRSSSRGRLGIADGDGYDGMRASGRPNFGTMTGGHDYYGNDSAPSSGREEELYESLHRSGYPSNLNSSARFNSRYNDLDAGSTFDHFSTTQTFQDYALSPPKPSDSISFRRGNLSPQRLRSSFDGTSSLRNSGTLQVARTSPSKVGSKMWGSDTPLARKGRVPHVSEDKWCCAVCLYVENPANAENCLVCDSPNYTVRKDYQVKEQCRNCTFLNGQFAEECEMCGEPLTHSQLNKSRGASSSINTPSNRNRRDVYY